MRFRILYVSALLFFTALPSQKATAAEDVYSGPVFDAHIHYSRAAWEEFPPAAVITAVKAAKVTGAIVSSTPDDGTLMLHDAAPDLFIPFIRPYRQRTDLGSWYKDPALIPYVEERLARGVHRGIGEVHLPLPVLVARAEVRRYLRWVVEKNLFLHLHADAAVVDAVFEAEPEIKIIWAHAGMSDPVGVVAATLDKHKNIWAESSFREDDILPGDTLVPAWRALLIRHADRFLVGTDPYVPERWHEYGALVWMHRQWLGMLPPAVADQIAHGNAQRLFGK